jgi:hypothetical protein
VSPLALAQSGPLTLEDVAALRSVTSVRISPDGDRIAYLLMVPRELYKEDDGRPYHELHMVDFEGNSTPYEIDHASRMEALSEE